VQGAGCRVQGLGYRVQGLGFRFQGLGFRGRGSGFRVQGKGFGEKVYRASEHGLDGNFESDGASEEERQQPVHDPLHLFTVYVQAIPQTRCTV